MTGEEVITAYNDREFVFSIKSRDGTGDDNDAWNRGQVLKGGFYIQNNGGEYNLGDDVILEDFHTTDDVEGVEPIHEKETNSLFGAKKSNEEATEEEPVVAPAPKRLMKNALMGSTPTRGGDTAITTSAGLKAALQNGTNPIILDSTLTKKVDGVDKYYFPIDEPLEVSNTVEIKTKNGKEIIIARSTNFKPMNDKPAIFNVVSGGNLTLSEQVTMTGAEIKKPIVTKMKLSADNKYFGIEEVGTGLGAKNKELVAVDKGSAKDLTVDSNGYLLHNDGTTNYRFQWNFRTATQNQFSDMDYKVYALVNENTREDSPATSLEKGVTYVALAATATPQYITYNSSTGQLGKTANLADAIRFTGTSADGTDESENVLEVNDKTGNDAWTADKVLPGGYFIHATGGGKVTLNSGVSLQNLNTAADVTNAAPVYIDGGEFTMNGGTITGNTIGYIGDGDTLDSTALVKDIANAIKGEDGTGKSNMTNTAGGVIFTNKSTGTISGGSIKGNRADAGGILVTEESTVTFSGGSINSNIGVHHAGAAQVEHGGTLVMDGDAEMKNNIAWYKGGAVWATEWGTSGYAVANWSNWPNEFPTLYEDRSQRSSKGGGNFVMDGGYIENNTAFARAGAVEVESNGVQLNGGYIRNNNSRSLGGAIYIEGDSPNYSYTLALPKGYITDNEAIYHHGTNGKNTTLNRKIGSTMDANGNWLVASSVDSYDEDFNGAMGNGGGVWLCPVGGTSVFTGGDIYIWNNESQRSNASGKTFENNGGSNGGEDFYLHKGNGSAMLQLSNMNGTWFDEQTGKSISDGVKSGPLSMINTTDYTTGTDGVVITGNLARDGGAIACNGTFIIGQPKDVHRYNARLNLNKTWANGTDNKGRVVNLKLQYLYPLDGDPKDDNNWHDLKYMPASANDPVNYEVNLNGSADNLEIKDAIGEIEPTNNGRTWNAAAFIPLYIDHNGQQIPLYVLENPAKKNYQKDDESIDFSTLDELDLSNEAHVGHLYYYINEAGQTDGNGKKLDNLNIAKWNLRVAETVKVGNQDVTTNYRVETSDPEKGSASAYADNIVLKDPLDQTTIKSQFSITYTTSTFSQGLVNEVASADVVLTKKDDKNQPVVGARFLVVEAKRDDTGDYRVAGDDGRFTVDKHEKTYDKKPEGETFTFDVKGLEESDRIVSASDGTFKINKLRPGQTYFLFEYETPNAYQTHYAPWLIKVSADGKTVDVYAIDDNYRNKVKDCPNGGDGSIIDYTDRKVWRKYWPEGWYGLSANSSKNTISQPVQSHTIKNETVKVELLKTDKEGNAITKDAKFTLYGVDRATRELFDENGNPSITNSVDIGVARQDNGANYGTVLSPVISEARVNSQDGKLVLDNLSRDVAYLLFETEAPEGYKREKAPWLIYVKKDGTYKLYRYKATTYKGQNPKNDNLSIDNPSDTGWTNLEAHLAYRWWPTGVNGANFEEITSVNGAPKQIKNNSLNIEFEKVSKENTTLKLTTAKFDLYHAVSTNDPETTGYKYKIDPNKPNRINSQDITNKNGKYILPITQSGMYLLFETEAPAGYVKPVAPWGIWVDADGGVRAYKLKDTEFETYQTRYANTTDLTDIEIDCTAYEQFTGAVINNRRKPIELTKYDSENESTLLSGARFQILPLTNRPATANGTVSVKREYVESIQSGDLSDGQRVYIVDSLDSKRRFFEATTEDNAAVNASGVWKSNYTNPSTPGIDNVTFYLEKHVVGSETLYAFRAQNGRYLTAELSSTNPIKADIRTNKNFQSGQYTSWETGVRTSLFKIASLDGTTGMDIRAFWYGSGGAKESRIIATGNNTASLQIDSSNTNARGIDLCKDPAEMYMTETEAGKHLIAGLASGYYQIVETASPDGYQLVPNDATHRMIIKVENGVMSIVQGSDVHLGMTDGTLKLKMSNDVLTSRKARKVWGDSTGAPSSIQKITFNLYSVIGDTRTLVESKDVTSSDWNKVVVFDNLPKYTYVDGSPVEIGYDIKEEAVPGYIATYEESGETTVVTNKKFKGGKVKLTIDKTWLDENGQNLTDDSLKKDVEVDIYYDNTTANKPEYLKTVTLTADTNWILTLTGDDALPMYATNGTRKLNYWIKEKSMDNFTSVATTEYQEATETQPSYEQGAEFIGHTFDNNSAGGQYNWYAGYNHTIDKPDGTSEIVYCLNANYKAPNAGSASGTKYKRVEITPKNVNLLRKYMQEDTNTFTYEGKQYSTGRTWSIAYKGSTTKPDYSTLYYTLLKLAYYGYGGQDNDWIKTSNLDDDLVRHLTQYAVHEYADFYYTNTTARKDYTHKDSVTTGIVDGYMYDRGPFGLIRPTNQSGDFDGYNYRIHNQRQLQSDYLALLKKIEATSDEEISKLGLKLYIYEPVVKTTEGGRRYQNLIGVETAEVNKYASISNKLDYSEITLYKHSSKNVDEALGNVEFDLYEEVEAGTTGATTLTVGGATKTVIRKNAKNKPYKTSNLLNKGEVKIKGLLNDRNYYLVERRAVDGYILLSSPIAFTLSGTEGSETYNWSDGQSDVVTLKAGASITTRLNVANEPMYELPSAGGMGTYWFMVIGAMMMAFAATILIIRKKGNVKL